MGFLYRLEFANGKNYVGITLVNTHKRLSEHRKRARLGSAFPVHVAWRKYGEPVLILMAEIADKDALGVAEIEAIANLKTFLPSGYNATTGGYTAPTKSPYVARKLAVASKGFTLEAIAKGRAILKGRALTDEHKKKLSEALRGRCPAGRCSRLGARHTEASKEKMRAGNLGKTPSAETRERIRAAHLGKKRPPEICQRISDAKRAAFAARRGEA